MTTERLVDGLYGARPPGGAVNALRSQVARLRRLLGDTVRPHPAGYRVVVDTDDVDAHRFQRLAAAGRKASDQGDHARAADLLAEALQLWRGPALVDVDAPFAAAQAARLEELRITVVEERIEAELRCGKGGSVVAELRELVAGHPLRERLYVLLIKALAGAGRQAEALAAYAEARRLLADELGADPSPGLRAVHLAVLRGHLPALPDAVATGGPDRPGRPVRPRTLPATIGDFTGRLDHLATIHRTVKDVDADGGSLAVPIVAISGRAGVGKTTLAVHAAHDLGAVYPDGQLFASLHAGGGDPAGPTQILARFLRMLDVHGTAIPDSIDERAELFRNLLADRRVLVVLDDVAGEDDVVPLLPGSRNCAVLVTCRRRLPGLAGAVRIDLGRFEPEQSLDLLSRLVGGDRVRQEPAPARKLAELCGHLPLALRIAGARLAMRPHWSVAQIADRLADEERRLDELVHGGMAVRAGIWLMHDALSAPARRLFRLLAVLDAHAFPAWAAAALLDQPLGQGQEHLEELVDAHLVEAVDTGRGAHTHYRFHDLIRGFARQRLASDEPAAQRSAALRRALDALLCLCRAAAGPVLDDRLRRRDRAPAWSPPPDLVEEVRADPTRWFESQHRLIVAAVHQAARGGLSDPGLGLAMAVRQFLIQRAYHDDALAVLLATLRATRRAADRAGEAAVLLELGTFASGLRRYADAEGHLAAAETLCREVGDEQGVAVAIRGQAFVHYSRGRTTDAARLFRQALATVRSLGVETEIAYILQVLAGISLIHGDVAAAEQLAPDAVRHARASGNPRVLAQALHRTGQVHLRAGRLDVSAGSLDDALALARSVGDVAGEAHILTDLGRVRLRLGRTTAALAALHQARDRAGTIHDPLVRGHAMTALGEAALAHDHPRWAADCLQRAAEHFRRADSRIDLIRALVALGDAQRHAGRHDAARRSRDEAERLVVRRQPLADPSASPAMNCFWSRT
ncbi:BTAD domain-containing putative transcriptional regulator [Dactylosporangium roseum]